MRTHAASVRGIGSVEELLCEPIEEPRIATQIGDLETCHRVQRLAACGPRRGGPPRASFSSERRVSRHSPTEHSIAGTSRAPDTDYVTDQGRIIRLVTTLP